MLAIVTLHHKHTSTIVHVSINCNDVHVHVHACFKNSHKSAKGHRNYYMYM